jgi:hypothetical protein
MLSTYKLLYQLPTPLFVSEDMYVIPVELMNDTSGDTGYTNALATIEVVGPSGSNPVITANDGFFAPGFSLPSSYDDSINIGLQFDMAGSYSIKVKLIDKDNGDAIITENDQTVYVDSSVDVANARTAVEQAETSKLQYDVDSARTLVNALSDSSDKTDLSARLDVVQATIDNAANLITATNAVVTAENSKLQSDVDYARSLVNTLPSGTDKTSLSSRLDVVQNSIDATNNAIAQLQAATNAVVTAEGSKLQADVDSAKVLVNALPDGSDKISLISRLDVVQAAINANTSNAAQLQAATNAVVIAEGSKLQADIDYARSLVNALPNSNDKTSLSGRLDTVQNEINSGLAQQVQAATDAVLSAEDSVDQEDVDTARALVNALPSGTDKSNLLARLDVVQSQIDKLQAATNAVVTAETSKLQSDVDTARALVNALAYDEDKAPLNTRLDVVQNSINLAIATAAVVKAEGSLLQADLDAAKVLVNALPASADRGALIIRVNTVQTKINDAIAQQTAIALQNATVAVEQAEASKLQADVDAARALANALPDSTDKNNLEFRLDAIQNELNLGTEYTQKLQAATTAVETAEASQLQSDVDAAFVLVNGLISDANKTDLINRLNIVQTAINNAAYQQQVQTATDAVVKAEGSKLQADEDAARSLVNALPSGSDKTSLSSRLDVVQTAINQAIYQAQVDAATANVVTAETSKLQSDVDSARTVVSALPDGSDKDSLNARLDAVQNSINDAAYQQKLDQATAAVVTAETSKLQADVDSARVLVNALAYDANKTALLARLDAVQNAINLAIATNAVAQAEGSKLQSDIDAARTLVNALPNGSDKDSLVARLDAVEYSNKLQAATAAVVKAEGSKLQSDVDTAKSLVSALPSGTDKTSLSGRLDTVQATINANATYAAQLQAATDAVVKAETSKLQADIDAAQALVNVLPDNADRTGLQSRINYVISYNLAQQNAVAAIDAYELTMQAFSAGDIDAFTAAYANLDSKRAEAFAAFSALPDGDDKTALENRYYVAESKQYSAYKMTLLGFTNGNELQPVKIENVGGTTPYKVTFKGVIPGQATAAYMFYPEDYLAVQTGNPLYPRDMPTDVISQTPAGSDSITLSNQYVKGGQFLIVYEIANNWYKFVFEMNDAGQVITEVNQQPVSGIESQGSTWYVSRQSLIDKVNEANAAIAAHIVGLNIGEVTQEAHDTFAQAIADAIVVRDTTDLLDINQINSATATLETAKVTFLATVNLINRETITDSINEANNLINNTTVGGEVGQVTQEAMDLLVTEVSKAVIIRNDTSASQTVIDAEEAALISAINNFKANTYTAANYADMKMRIYETAAQDFLAQVLAKKKI